MSGTVQSNAARVAEAKELEYYVFLKTNLGIQFCAAPTLPAPPATLSLHATEGRLQDNTRSVGSHQYDCGAPYDVKGDWEGHTAREA
jgi:hypothetical protein